MVHNIPLTPEHRGVVTSLGYLPVAGYADAPEQRFFHPGKNVQLFFVRAGSLEWTNYLLVRDFLKHSERARRMFLEAQTQSGDKTAKAPFSATLLKNAEAWWSAFHGFAPVERAARELGAFAHPWSVSSGWALDLFMGRVSRVHHDIDVVIPRTAVHDLQRYLLGREWKLVLPLDGKLKP